MAQKKRKMIDDTVRRIVRETKPIAPWLCLGMLLDVLSVVAAVIAPELLGKLVQVLYDYGLSDRTGSIRPALVEGLMWLLLVYAAYGLFSFLNSQLMNRTVSRHFTCDLRIKISDKLQRLPVKYVDQTPVGDILNRLGDDVGNMGGYLHQIFDVLVKGFFQLLLIAAAMFLESPLLACFVVLAAPVSLWLSSRMAAACGKYYDTRFAQEGELAELVEESFTNFPTTKAYNLEEYTQEHHEELNRKLRDSTAKSNFTGGIVQPLIAFSNSVAYILINLVGGWLMVRRGLSVGTVVTIVLYARQFASPLEQIANGLANLSQIKACAARVFQLLDIPEEAPGAGSLLHKARGEVEFRHVDFSYKPEEPLIRDLNLNVMPGQKIAIVGPTGAGKTTIVNLLMRFYDLDAGAVLLDGQDMKAVSRKNVREQFGMVLQDTWLFRGTIAENVAYGVPDATREQIEAVCRKARCDRFIRTMPKGYDTVIGEDTVNLSGGQRQLLTIARALLVDRPLLILDEATSNVDTRTEILIQKAMDTLMEGRTCFIIAHRLSTIVDADAILVLDHGRIVEQGTHRDLLAKQGFYYKLYSSQYAV